jgi:hypothetical protein
MKARFPALLERRAQGDARFIAESVAHFGRVLPNNLLDLLEQ